MVCTGLARVVDEASKGASTTDGFRVWRGTSRIQRPVCGQGSYR